MSPNGPIDPQMHSEAREAIRRIVRAAQSLKADAALLQAYGTSLGPARALVAELAHFGAWAGDEVVRAVDEDTPRLRAERASTQARAMLRRCGQEKDALEADLARARKPERRVAIEARLKALAEEARRCAEAERVAGMAEATLPPSPSPTHPQEKQESR